MFETFLAVLSVVWIILFFGLAAYLYSTSKRLGISVEFDAWAIWATIVAIVYVTTWASFRFII